MASRRHWSVILECGGDEPPLSYPVPVQCIDDAGNFGYGTVSVAVTK